MRRPPKAARCALPLCLFVALLHAAPAAAVPPGNGKLQIIHLNAAQGNAAVLISPEGEVAMFDDGANTSYCTHCPSCAEVRSEILALGITHVKYHFTSHYHSDHIGCISQLSGITIDQGWDRGGTYSSGAFTSYTGYLGAKRRTLTKGKVFTLDSLSAHPVTIKCVALAGDGLSTTDENSLSVCMKVSYGEFDEEIGGDLEGTADGGGSVDVETRVGPQVGRVEAYLVHHHCSAYSTNENWLNATQPKIGIVTAGIGNDYGHPTASTLTRLHNHGVRTYWSELGQGASPNPTWDKVANGPIRIVATWEAGGVDSVYGNGFADSFTNYFPADVTSPTATVLSPTSGTVLAAGAPTNVTWSASDNVGVTSITLVYSQDDGLHRTLIGNGLPNTGSYSWTVPNVLDTQGQIELTARDAANNSTLVYSAPYFSVVDQTLPSVTLTAPNGGESLQSGSTCSVTWSAADNIGVQSVDLDYSTHGSAGPWLAVQHGLANAGSYAWTVDSELSDSVVVRVTAFDAATNQAADMSDGLVAVSQPPADVPGRSDLRFALAPVVPNPSRGLVSAQFSLARAGLTRLDVLDVSGRRVWGTRPEWLEAGSHGVAWDGRDDHGNPANLGLYFLRLSSGGNSAMARFVRLK